MRKKLYKCYSCGYTYREQDREFRTDEFGTYFEEICPNCHKDI